MKISRDDATTWAGWFKALGDPTRILILHLLATESRPMNVGEIVDALDVGQSTISHHLQILGETCFVHVERVGNSSWWRINDRCLDCFPSAAELIMGRLPLTVPWDDGVAVCAPDGSVLMNAEQRDPMLARYADAARRAGDGGCVCAADGSPFGAGHYDELDDLPAAAVRVSLGCGNPTAVADLHEGDTVLDLGSGGGLDVLLSARRVGPTGFVYGLDATAEMVELARRNATEAGVGNVEFLHGTIDHVPLEDASVDVVISNCVIVLATDKDAVFAEIARVLRPGGRVGISDIIRHGDDDGTAPAVDCAGRAITVADYAAKLRRAGLTDVSVQPTDPLGGGLQQRHHPRHQSQPSRVRAMEPADWPRRPHDLRGRHRQRQRHLRDHHPRPGTTGTEATSPIIASSPPTPTDKLSGGRRSARCPTAAPTPVSPRTASTSTPSIIVGASARILLHALIAQAEDAGLWTIQTGIFPENAASLTVHERAGFRVVGRRERIGRLAGVWRDTIFLERRSHRL